MKSAFLSFALILSISLLVSSCDTQPKLEAEQWKEIELTFTAQDDYSNPYTNVELWAEFIHTSGEIMKMPGFWYEGKSWKVRFASPYDTGEWTFTTRCDKKEDTGLNQSGIIICKPYAGDNNMVKHGFLKMSPGQRNVVYADGSPFLMIADTPWGLPYRGTKESVTAYSKNRQSRGINAALLMSLQPDMRAEGPDDRVSQAGFAKAFSDLPDGHINNLNPTYFQTLDTLIGILLEHEIVPVFQPVFHGFGWKGLDVLGAVADPDEYVRYSRYLLARYGASHAFWLVSGDNNGLGPGVKEAGEYIEEWDPHRQPTGIHYNPMCDNQPEWAPEGICFHYNKSYQSAGWLDFQWCQTGHAGLHDTHKVELMYDNLPTKAVANGEPTYEGIRDPENGSAWWQGHEAWIQYTSGGTMGVVYGAGGLWNWKLNPEEEGWDDWCNSNVSWKEAIELPGSIYVGYLGDALKGLNTTDIERHPELAEGNYCLAHPGKLYIIYLPEGGTVQVSGYEGMADFKWFDPQKGEFTDKGITDAQSFTASDEPAVLIIEIR
jgi:hypothetical protein